MNAIFYILLATAPLAGGLGGIYIHRGNRNMLKVFMAFSGAYLFSVTVISLIPEIYSQVSAKPAGLAIIGGFILQLVFEQFSKGVEHGHLHDQEHSHQKLPLGIFISLSMHSFLEGMPLGGLHFSDRSTFWSLLGGIALHELPASFALMTVMRHETGSAIRALKWLCIYCLMAPAGALLAQLLKYSGIESYVMPMLMAVVVGFFLHISTTILFENSENHLYNRIKLFAIACGVALACLMQF